MDYKISREDIEGLINDACVVLYRDHINLIVEAANEETIVADIIAPHLRVGIQGNEYMVSTTYNREGVLDKRQTKTGLDGRPILPDIIIHKFGPDGPNIAAIEVKGWWNKQNRAKDESSLRRLGAKHNYWHLYRLELGRDAHKLIPVYQPSES